MPSALHPSLRHFWSLHGAAEGAPSWSMDYEQILSDAGVLSSWVGYWTTYDSILGADPGIALNGSDVQSWTDQRSGFTVSAPGASQRPAYGADGSNFGGRSVVQCAATGSKFLIGDFGGTWIASGVPVTVLVVGRIRAETNNTFFFEVGDGDGDIGFYLLYHPTNDRWTSGLGGSVLQITDEGDTDQHLLTVQVGAPAGGTIMYEYPSGASGSHAGSSGPVGNATRMAIGARRTSTGPSDSNLAEILVIDTNIDADTMDALVAAVRAKWGIS